MRSVVLYRTIAIISFIILLSVQFYLAYNTYRLNNEQYFIAEKKLINEQYSSSIPNDKVFPGGQKIIDSFIYRNIYTLESYYKAHSVRFNTLSRAVCDSIFTDLRKSSNMDSLFKSIVSKNDLNKNLIYLLTVSGISVNFKSNKYIPLYNQADTSYKYHSSGGVIIDGTLKNPDKQNLVTNLNVTNDTNYSYQMSFSLYVDMPDRKAIILKRMFPVFLLSTFSILFVILIYFFTYLNWLKQKKLADMQSDFVNSITHEFNTPLSTIIVANRNLQNPNVYTSGKLILPLTSIIERQSQRLKTLFSRVLDITKMNESTLTKKEFVLADLLDEILLDYRLTIDEKNIHINYSNHAGDARVLLDKFWFATMLINILENAIKYNRSTLKKIDITITKADKDIVLSVKDNGIGISENKLEHIFEKFYRVNEKNTAEASGLGLGLYYTKQCIQAHNWKIGVKSKENEGTNFLIYMPEA